MNTTAPVLPTVYVHHPSKHPTPTEVESYRAGAHIDGMAEALAYLVDGSPTLAFLKLVATTEAEARIVGYGGHRIPTMDAVKRFRPKRPRAVA